MVRKLEQRPTRVRGALDRFGPPLESIGIGQLIARIDTSWDTRGEIRTKLQERVPALRARALQTNSLLLGLLKEDTAHS